MKTMTLTVDNWQDSSYIPPQWKHGGASIIRAAIDQPGEYSARYSYLHEVAHAATIGPRITQQTYERNMLDYEIRASALALCWVAPEHFEAALWVYARGLDSYRLYDAHATLPSEAILIRAMVEQRKWWKLDAYRDWSH